ncbi:siroheme decarboxylase subunit beta [Pseudogulbenkiania ferrooxidans]|uniref:Siroheme decarboxylase NirG subunit n=1 Tax=Pseudogulbenkiania ferrooxidans 2002 TaxID=279714 RepID=B9Z099_9NEIS|nr:AsnC family transcriptional regulator [Pseudogulbenkiania ferrooxidans]EEG09982.1 putative transcriptional regulator, AsnC family [Pseudogulbenkiania ferrooxidans 2002]
MTELDGIDRRLIDQLQGGFPLSPRPFAEAAAPLGITETELIARLNRLLQHRTLTRFGPLFQIERMGGAFVLAALAVPEQRFDEVAEQVNALPEVAHNYRREHRLNMWFVLATETPQGIAAATARIEAATGLTVHAFPKEREYFVGMRFAVGGTAPVGQSASRPVDAGPVTLDGLDRALVRATQAGLPRLPRPYHTLAEALGCDEHEVLTRLEAMLRNGVIRRIGAVPNHYAIGYTANGMAVFDVADDAVDRLGEQLGADPAVSHCYRRPRALPHWPYNLFAMVHGASHDQVRAEVARLVSQLGPACRSHDILFSSRILKKSGLRI